MNNVKIEKQTYTVDEVAKLIGISYRTLLTAIKRNELKTMRIGRQYKIPKAEVERLLQPLQTNN